MSIKATGRSSNRWALTRAAGLALGVAGLAGLPGCDDNAQVADAISDASIRMTAMVPAGSSTAAPSVDAKNYQALIADLKKVAGKGGAGQQAAVDLLTARAQLGLALQASAEAAEAERASLTSVAAVRSALQEYLAFSGQVGALSTFDPSPMLAELDAQIGQRETDLAAARKAKQDIDSRLADLASQAQGKMDQAAAERKIEADLRQQAMRVSDTEAAELIKQASVHRRLADGFDVEAATLEARAALLAPESPEAQLRIDQVTGQRDQLGKGREEIQRQAVENRRLMTTAKADQAKAAEAVDAAINALAAAREGDLPTRYRDAVTRLNEAADSASRAGKSSRGSSQLAVAEIKHALGDLKWSEAHGLAIAAETLEAAAGANPPLPGQGEYASQAAAARDGQKQALEAATEAYQAAKSAYEGAGSGGDAATRLEEVNRKLIQIINATSGGAVDLSAELADDQGAQDPTADAAADAPAGDAAGSPQATVAKMLELTKAGRVDRLVEIMYLPDPSVRDLVTGSLGLLAKLQRLEAVCRAKFGQSLDSSGSPFSPQAMTGMPPGTENLAASELSYSVMGQTASATHPDLPEPILLRQVDGQWLLDGSVVTAADAQGMQAAAAMIPSLNRALETIITDVEAGKYASVDQVNAVMLAEMIKAGPGGR